MVTTMLDGVPSAIRLLCGIAPVIVAVTWASVTKKGLPRNAHDRWGLPIAKRLVMLCAILFALITVGAPGRARIAFAHEGIWMIEALPDVPPLSWLRGMTEAMTSALAAFFDSVASVLTW